MVNKGDHNSLGGIFLSPSNLARRQLIAGVINSPWTDARWLLGIEQVRGWADPAEGCQPSDKSQRCTVGSQLRAREPTRRNVKGP